MSDNIIAISSAGVLIDGVSVGTTPKADEFEAAIRGDARSTPPLNGRVLKINDSKGLSWLIDLNSEAVLWLRICLSPADHRSASDRDPTDCFKGKIRIGQYTVQGPFSFEIGEVIRKVSIPSIGLDLIPGEKEIRALLIGFVKNENLSDAARN